MAVQEASYLTFSGLTFELCRQLTTIEVYGGEYVTFDGCTIKNTSGVGIWAGINTLQGDYIADYFALYGTLPPDEPTAELNGLHYSITNCILQNIGAMGAVINSGRITTRERGEFLFENNLVLNTGLIFNISGVGANGVGIKLLHNTIMFGGGFGMALGGSDSEMAYNEFIDMVCDTHSNDNGSICLHHDGMGWGLSCHDNYIHHMQRTPKREWEWGGYGTTIPFRMAIYVDNPGAGSEIYRNVIYDAPQGIGLPSSVVPETIANNLFIDVMVPVLAITVYKEQLEENLRYTNEQLIEVTGGAGGIYFTSGIYETAWKDVYPEFYKYFDYFINDKADITQFMLVVYNNICINKDVPLAVKELLDPSILYRHLSPMPPEDEVSPDPVYGRYENNRYLEYDPGLIDYAGYFSQLTKEAAALLGIEWVDLSAIGSTLFFTITFDSDGGTLLASREIRVGQRLFVPDIPIRDGFIFSGWYRDAGLTAEVVLPYMPVGNITLYARWTPDTGGSDLLPPTGDRNIMPWVAVFATLAMGLASLRALRQSRLRKRIER
jgi:uncharacterized repeat protein (TIGR02543 family)